jgi:alkanesulfonate monooxygenase SsuD/methylene tetrahydromethanopterin reductase-like flavin-dependent oxidoreductase (luciferase family)
MRMALEVMVDRARAAEGCGFDGIALMDHLAPPLALDQPMYEAMTTAAWLLARTERLSVGHLVLCDAFRHPAVLARQAVTLDHASGGRFELGIGWGSVPDEFPTYGIGDTTPKVRVGRLAESLEIMRGLWSGQPIDFDGDYFKLIGAQQLPVPLANIPLLIGGFGPKTLALAAKHADWWNLPVHGLTRLEELRPQVGDARVSIQQMVGFAASESERERVTEQAKRRYGAFAGLVVGTPGELVEHFGALAERGVERFYTWFTDFADPATLEMFGELVITPLKGRSR